MRQLRVSEHPGDEGRGDADGGQGLLRLHHLAHQARHLGLDAAVGTLDGEVAEVLGGAEAAGEDQGVEVGGLDLLDVLDLAAGDSYNFV